MKGRTCELCNDEASLYCASDSAFLCWNCDTRVHDANFLVARHIRELLCHKCNCFAGNQISGGKALPVTTLCRSCSPENLSDDDDSLSSSSSVCVSSNESCATASKNIRLKGRRKREGIASCSFVTKVSGEKCNTPAEVTLAKTVRQQKERELRERKVGSRAGTSVGAVTEEVFVNWSRKLGVNGNSVASLASRALGFCMGKLRAVPFRVAVATSFWMGLISCGDRSVAPFENLRRLEAISGVPGKLILAAERRLARVLKQSRGKRVLKEGWAECQV